MVTRLVVLGLVVVIDPDRLVRVIDYSMRRKSARRTKTGSTG